MTDSNKMSDAEFLEALSNIRYKAPDWMVGTTIDEQIQYQVIETRKAYPDRKSMVVFTYDKNRKPQLQKQCIDI